LEKDLKYSIINTTPTPTLINAHYSRKCLTLIMRPFRTFNNSCLLRNIVLGHGYRWYSTIRAFFIIIIISYRNTKSMLQHSLERYGSGPRSHEKWDWRLLSMLVCTVHATRGSGFIYLSNCPIKRPILFS